MKSLPIFIAYNSNKLQPLQKTTASTSKTIIHNKPFLSPSISANTSLSKDKRKKSHDETNKHNNTPRLVKANVKYPSNISTKSQQKEIPSKIYESCINKMFLYLKSKVSNDIYLDVYNTYKEELNKEIYNSYNTNSLNSNSMSTLKKGLKLSYEMNTKLSEEDENGHTLSKKINGGKNKRKVNYNNSNNNAKVKSYCNKSNMNLLNNHSSSNNFYNIHHYPQNINVSSSTSLRKHSLYTLTKKGRVKYIQGNALSQNNSKSNSLERLQSFPKGNSRPHSKKSSLNKSRISKNKSNNIALNHILFDKISKEIRNNIRANLNANINYLNYKGVNNKSTRNYNFNRTTTNSLKKSKNSNSKPKYSKNNNNITTNKKIKTFRPTLSYNQKKLLSNKENIQNNSLPKKEERTLCDDSNFELKKNSEQLKQIKSSLDDDLKVMFNFSYEGFLNKESESESRRSCEQQETRYHYLPSHYYSNNKNNPQQNESSYKNIVL